MKFGSRHDGKFLTIKAPTLRCQQLSRLDHPLKNGAFLRDILVLALLMLLTGMLPSYATGNTPLSYSAGYQSLPADDVAPQASFGVWYPVPALIREAVMIGGNKVFVGTPAARNADIAPGRFHVVALTHGGLRSAPHLVDWLAQNLARQGYIVVTSHADKVGPDNAVAQFWQRPALISTSLDLLFAKPVFQKHAIDAKVTVIGAQLGGSAALMTAGARLDPSSFRQACDQPGVSMDCGWFKNNGIDLHQTPTDKIAQSRRDKRVANVIAIDPELTSVMTDQSLGNIDIPVHILNMGTAQHILPALNARNLADHIPAATYHSIDDATRFSVFAVCQKNAAKILGEDDVICRDGPNKDTSRAKLHDKLAKTISAFLVQDISHRPTEQKN